MADLSWLTVIPIATVFLMAVALVTSILSQSIYRMLINHFIGWNEYRVMQKEMSEFNRERMAAARANDTKQLEKLKKKESQINAMRTKMLKPQMANMGFSVVYLVIWYFLRPIFTDMPVAYLPGFTNGLSLFFWYMPASFFINIVMQRVLGTLPVE